ncbi:MAG TPA: metalloregulator ArsR/SmtB family transcription factor [Patescibacteria group bacterium]|nr:metalloregulator ArsR/SmtB family transcription factor [Patescibacteria group bacterium]
MKLMAYNPHLNHESYYFFFGKLANPLRMGIILSLREGDKSVSEITEELQVEQSKISHALCSLKNCNILMMRQDGKQRIYSLNKDTIVPILKLVEEHSNKHCRGNCSMIKNIKNKEEIQ